MFTIILCYISLFLFLALFYIWGRCILSALKIQNGFCDSIIFGFVFLLTTYQIIYLPFFLTRGSYKILSWIWIGIIGAITIPLTIKQIRSNVIPTCTIKDYIVILITVIFIIFLCIFIPLHAPVYGQDTNAYINGMNRMYYEDVIWIDNGEVNIHNGSNSLFAFLTLPSLVFQVKPYYSSLITMRSLLIILMFVIAYRIGKIAFDSDKEDLSYTGIAVAFLTTFFLFSWNSMYQPQFFYRRSNEAKSYCQFVLHPLAFSVFLQMFKENADRRRLWITQVFIGLSAMAISMSSLTGYPFLILMGMAALLIYDKCKKGYQTILYAFLCAAPNLIYLLFDYIVEHGFIRL